MTQQEFNSLEVGDFISNYEILHKYKEFLIVRCDDGHDLFDLEKINKLGLSVKPKTFMGLEIKEYDNVPCEINDKLYYLIEVTENEVVFKQYKKQNLEPFESIFLRLGVVVLQNATNFLAANPDKTVQDIKTELAQLIKDLQTKGDPVVLKQLETQLRRIQKFSSSKRRPIR